LIGWLYVSSVVAGLGLLTGILLLMVTLIGEVRAIRAVIEDRFWNSLRQAEGSSKETST
jgi:hypothetical protein